MWPNPQLPADMVTFTEEIRIEKLHFLCCESSLYKIYWVPTKNMNNAFILWILTFQKTSQGANFCRCFSGIFIVRFVQIFSHSDILLKFHCNQIALSPKLKKSRSKVLKPTFKSPKMLWKPLFECKCSHCRKTLWESQDENDDVGVTKL